MDVNSPARTAPSSRVLVVSDWRADPASVIAACRAHAAGGDVAFALVVPAWLHGLDWVGDPTASRPCGPHQTARPSEQATAVAAMSSPAPQHASKRRSGTMRHRVARQSLYAVSGATFFVPGSWSTAKRKSDAKREPSMSL